MIKSAALFFLLLAGLSPSLKGQNEASSPVVQPTPPFLANLPATASWQIDFQSIGSTTTTSAGAPSLPQPQATLKQILVAKAHGVRRETLVWSDGKQSENWIVGSEFLFRQDPRSGQYSLLSPDMTPYDAAALNDFPDLSWIDLHHFVEVKTQGQASYFVYACKQRPGGSKSATATSYAIWNVTGNNNKPNKFSAAPPFKPVTVWIDTQTKLPLTSEDGELQATYTFNLPAPTLTLPADLQKLLDGIVAARKRIQGQQMATPPTPPVNPN